jgi:amylosucrase
LIGIRKSHPSFAVGDNQMIDLANDHVLGYIRQVDGERMMAIANFTEDPQVVDAKELRLQGLLGSLRDLVTEREISMENDFELAPYQFVWLVDT